MNKLELQLTDTELTEKAYNVYSNSDYTLNTSLELFAGSIDRTNFVTKCDDIEEVNSFFESEA